MSDAETTNMVNKLNKICKATNLTFDGPGRRNWRRRKGVYHVYFRASTDKACKFLEPLRANWKDSKFTKMLLTEFESVAFKGGAADFGASFNLKAK